MPTPCIFCGANQSSKEHVISDWIREALKPPLLRRVESRLHPHQAASTYVKIKQDRPGSVFTVRPRVVCATNCNNGWMSRLETAAKPFVRPMIFGESISLEPAALGVVATWAAKTATIAEYMNKSSRTVPVGNRRYLMEHQLPPPGTQVWLGRYPLDGSYGQIAQVPYQMGETPGVVGEGDRDTSWLPEDVPDASAAYNAQFTVISISHVLFIVQMGPETIRYRRLGLHPIWPLPSGALEWPPLIGTDMAVAVEFANFIGGQLGAPKFRWRSGPATMD